jgi:hypothetical protein
MNERIRELAKEAERQYGGMNVVDIEKFAELIVRECVSRILRVGVLEDIEQESDMIADAIKEHFGVEE